MADRSPRDQQQPDGRPWLLLAPALALIAAILVLPVLRTVWLAFADEGGAAFSGIENLRWALDDREAARAALNSLIWIALTAIASTAAGLLLALLVHRLRARSQSLLTALALLPAAISGVAAAATWRLVYAFRADGDTQVGVLNALTTSLGAPPVAWLTQQPLNTPALVAVLVWCQAGAATVLLSAALAGVPRDLTDAAALDGASPQQVFWRITVPGIKGTLALVAAMTSLTALKVYDLVVTATGGAFDTQVLATAMFDQAFVSAHGGRGALLALILLLAASPVMLLAARRSRSQP